MDSPLRLNTFAPNAEITEVLVAASARARYDDLLSIRTILNLVDELVLPAAAISGLCADIERNGPSFDARLRSPAFRGWLNRFAHVQAWSVDDRVLREQLAFAENMRVSFSDPGDWSTTLAVFDGICQTWDGRIALAEFDGDYVQAEKRGSRVRLSVSATRQPDIDLADSMSSKLRQSLGLCGTNIVVRNDLPLLKLKMRENQVPSRNGGLNYGEFDLRPSTYCPFDVGVFRAAFELVQETWTEEFADWETTLRVVVPRSAPSGWEVNGFTVASHQGACWIVARGLPAVLEALVHEQSHIKLRYIEESHPLLEASQTLERFAVGWRSDLRPIEGILEGVYVNLHSIEALLRAAPGMDLAAAASAYRRVIDLDTQVTEAIRVIERHAHLTTFGMAFLQWASEHLSRRTA